jgi:hypothetical protein
MMTASDLKFVISKVTGPLQTMDPFTDDFYMLQFQIKSANQAAVKAAKEGRPPPPQPSIPLPAWKDVKEKIRLQMEETRKGQQVRSSEWSEKEQTLGKSVKSNVNKPKQVLAVPVRDVEDNDEGETAREAPFSTRLWSMRSAVQKGCAALYTVQELQHLLQNPMIAANPHTRADIMMEVETAVSLLSQAIGIKPSSSNMGPPTDIHGDNAVEIDAGLIAAILQSSKGKKLMSRSLKLLVPQHRWALVPAILSKVLQNDPDSMSKEDITVEKRLLRTVMAFMTESQEHQNFLAKEQLPEVATFSSSLLSKLRQCLKNAMVAQTEKSLLRKALLPSRTRAEVFHVIVRIGDTVSPSAQKKTVEDWESTKEGFLKMLDG